MIETSNPEVDVNALVERIRAEAAKISTAPVVTTRPSVSRRRPAALQNIAELAPPPRPGFSKPVDTRKERLEGALQKSRRMIEVRRWIPKIIRGWFRNQNGFNHALLDAVALLAKTNLQLSKRVHELMAAAQQQDHWLRQLAAHRQAEARWMQTAAGLLSEMGGESAALRAQIEELGGVRAEVERAGEHLRNLQREAEHAAAQIHQFEVDATRLTGESARLGREIAHLRQSDERLANDAMFIKGDLAAQRSWVQRLAVAEPGVAAPTDVPPVQREDDHALDAFYLSFEDRFRGKRADIKERLRFYVPLVQEANAGTAEAPVLDVGCGRGEWLELLREAGLEAAGVDLNRRMIAECEQRGLAAREADAVEYLRSLPDESVGAVTGFHIIEHLPLGVLVDLVRETRRVLRPGGIAAFESPNCKNLMVGACYFNIDPTHRNPVFPDTAQFLFETLGFADVRLEYLSPAEGSPFNGEDATSRALRELLYGPQDFAVIGRKPAA